MNHESFIQLFIEFGPAEFQGATLWINRTEYTSVPKESEVIDEELF